jgi:hypothetical protein
MGLNMRDFADQYLFSDFMFPLILTYLQHSAEQVWGVFIRHAYNEDTGS